MIKRLSLIQKELRNLEIPAILIDNLTDIKYLSGFTGSTAYMIVDIEKAVLYTDGRYTVQATEEVYEHILVEIINDYSTVFTVSCAQYKKILLQPTCKLENSNKITSANVDVYLDEKDFIKKLRMLKTSSEIKLIKEQYDLAAKAFIKTMKNVKYDQTERKWAATLEYYMKTLGANGESFETIVASGIRGAMPHGVASDKIVNKEDPVIFDFGSRNDYNSDYTRMVYSGNDKEVLDVIDIVRVAMEKAIDGIEEGLKCSDIDNIARSYISEKGYGDYFTHSLGHGIGLDVHELPYISKKSEFILEDGMIFTVEPGIYIKDKFGVRLEQTVLVTGGKAEIISTYLDKYIYNPLDYI